MTQEKNQLVQLDAMKNHELGLPSGYRIPNRKGSEYVDDLLRRVYQVLPTTNSAVVGVMSCTNLDATTTTTINLATRAADHLLTPTLIVDANSVSPRLSKRYGNRGHGLVEYAAGNASLEKCIKKTKVKDLSFMGIGDRRMAKNVSLQSSFLNEIRSDYRLTLVELPSIDGPSGVDGFMSHLDGVIIVAKYGEKQRHVKQLNNHIRNVGGEVLGLVMTGRQSFIPRWLRNWF